MFRISEISLKFVLLSFVYFVFIACGNKSTNTTDEARDSSYIKIDTSMVKVENPKITAYKSFVLQLDSVDSKSLQLAVDEFKRVVAGQSLDLGDSAYVVLQNFADSLEYELNIQLQNDTLTDFEAILLNKKPTGALLKLVNELKMSGFRLNAIEGTVYIALDRKFVLSQISMHLTEPMQRYIQQIDIENKEGFLNDASICISANKYVERLIWYENFIKENPSFLLVDNCKNYKKAYLTYFLTGIDNTQLYENEEDMKLAPYFVKSYNYVLKTYPDSELSQLVAEYKTAIEQKNKSLVNELIKKYIIKGWIYSQNTTLE